MRRVVAFAAALALSPCVWGRQVHIGVLGLYHPQQLELQASDDASLVVTIDGNSIELRPGLAEDTAKLSISDNRLLLAVRGREYTGSELRAGGRDRVGFFALGIPGKIRRRYRGSLLVAVRNGELAPAVNMDLEAAVASVVEAESDPDAPLEALKAQAVVTRSYFAAGGRRHENFDFCDLTHCQVMRGMASAGGLAMKAAAETQGLALAYRGKPFAAMFTRSCGGRTRTPLEDELPSGAYPYFAVACDYCHTNPARWTRTLSRQDAATAASGEARRLRVNRKLGWNTIPSNSFASKAEGDEMVLQGTGQGHGIGLCQRGAKAMAEAGTGFRTILQRYFPNTTLLNLAQGESESASR